MGRRGPRPKLRGRQRRNKLRWIVICDDCKRLFEVMASDAPTYAPDHDCEVSK